MDTIQSRLERNFGAVRRPLRRARRLVGVVAAAGLALSAGDAHAQWTAVSLHPAGAGASQVLAGSGGTQGGWAYFGDQTQGGVWTGTADSWEGRTPPGTSGDAVYGVSGTTQVGIVTIAGVGHAVMWHDGTWLDLTPPGFAGAVAYGIDGNTQVGVATVVDEIHACLWHGTPASWIDLHPTGAVSSFALCVHADQQAGFVEWESGVPHACVWTGAAASFVDLHPAFASDSAVNAIGAQSQGGYGAVPWQETQVEHAVLWRGSAESAIDLNPAGAISSQVFGVDGEFQVGQTLIGEEFSASLWKGSSSSWVNLGRFLPAGYGNGNAQAIWRDASFIYVGGWAENRIAGVAEAMLWKRPITCIGDFNDSGVIGVQDIFDFLTAYFGNDPAADVNGAEGVNVQDIFDFLAAYFAGCA